MTAHDAGFAKDRAAAVTVTIIEVLRRALHTWLHQDNTDFAAARTEIESILRGEFDDVARQAANEIRYDD
jgi:hypothetical protein